MCRVMEMHSAGGARSGRQAGRGDGGGRKWGYLVTLEGGREGGVWASPPRPGRHDGGEDDLGNRGREGRGLGWRGDERRVA